MTSRRLALLAAGAIFIVVAGGYFGYARAAIAFAMSAAVLWLGFSYFRSAGEAPQRAATEDLVANETRFVCGMCGLELKVEVMGIPKPPTHCREAMKVVNAPDRPPLKPV